MKKTLVLILILLAVVVNATEKAPWVDMLNCPICKNVTAEDGLMQNMTWEHHLTSTGMMTVTTVNPEFQAHFERAKANMMKKVGEVMAGEKLDLCDYCISVTTLFKGGVKPENVITKGSDIMVLNSTDEATISKIHKHGQATIDFMHAAHASQED